MFNHFSNLSGSRKGNLERNVFFFKRNNNSLSSYYLWKLVLVFPNLDLHPTAAHLLTIFALNWEI